MQQSTTPALIPQTVKAAIVAEWRTWPRFDVFSMLFAGIDEITSRIEDDAPPARHTRLYGRALELRIRIEELQKEMYRARSGARRGAFLPEYAADMGVRMRDGARFGPIVVVRVAAPPAEAIDA